jgi:hypothetical protein
LRKAFFEAALASNAIAKSNRFAEGSMSRKVRSFFAFFLSMLAPLSAGANIQPYPNSFSVQEIRANGTTLHVRVGGTGPAVVLLHGFADTGDMWAPLAAALASDHTGDCTGSSQHGSVGCCGPWFSRR